MQPNVPWVFIRAGLDPDERVRFRNLLTDLSGERLIILSTHVVSDVEATATSIAIIKNGRLIMYDSPECILQAVEGKVWTWVVSSDEFARLKQTHLISNTARRSDGVHVCQVADQKPDREAQPVDASLEDAYHYFVQSSRVQ